MLTLYAIPVSVYAAKVRIAAALMGVPLAEVAPPDGYGSAAYKRIVPQGSVPALVHDGFVLAESDAIVEYLDEIGAGRPLMPRDPQARARNRELARFADLKLELAARALYPHVGKPEVPPHLAEALVRNTAALSGLVTPAPFLTGAAPSLADCALLAAGNVLKMMETHLPLPLPWPAWYPAYEGAAMALPGLAPILASHHQALDAWAVAKRG